MMLSLVLGCVWALVATGTAFLPLRRQMGPGLCPLLAARVVVGWFALDHGARVGILAGAAVLSIFRRPVITLTTSGSAA